MTEKQLPKLSVIVCSIKPHEAEALRENIAQTIGVEHEVIVHDNREECKGICRVYNECAERAEGDYLCFVHEDVAFHTPSWGEKIIAKLSEPTCGVIGFAGSTVKYAYRYGWQGVRRFTRKHYVLGSVAKGGSLRSSANGEEFDSVICLDGMCLCVRRDVWAACRFDEEQFAGFHSYDTDFTTAVTVAGYTNYVCYSVVMEHRSKGSFSSMWYESVQKYNEKWADKLPLYTSEHSRDVVNRFAAPTEAFGLGLLIKNKILSRKDARHKVVNFWRRNKCDARAYALIFRHLRTIYEQ